MTMTHLSQFHAHTIKLADINEID